MLLWLAFFFFASLIFLWFFSWIGGSVVLQPPPPPPPLFCLMFSFADVEWATCPSLGPVFHPFPIDFFHPALRRTAAPSPFYPTPPVAHPGQVVAFTFPPTLFLFSLFRGRAFPCSFLGYYDLWPLFPKCLVTGGATLSFPSTSLVMVPPLVPPLKLIRAGYLPFSMRVWILFSSPLSPSSFVPVGKPLRG